MLLAGCEVKINVAEKNQFKGAGIVFEIPMETSDATTGTYGISYKSERFSAESDGQHLLVDGKDYGNLRTGDIVDFYDYPTIRVNGTVRFPSGA